MGLAVTRRPLSILNATTDPNLFGSLLTGQTWAAWRTFLAVLFGLPLTAEQLALAHRCTGRQTFLTTPAREAAVVVGRRGGKSYIAALIAVFLATCRDYSAILSPGEWGVVVLIASDRRQARVLKRYISGLLRAVPMLAQLIYNETNDALELTNGITIEIHTASFRAIRGYTVVSAICDEVAFWPTDDAASPDTEILTALRPAMATVPHALLLLISTPYSRRGELWKAYKQHFGQDGDPVVVWAADTRTMNPSVPQAVIDAAYADDEASASAEYGGLFRKDVDVFIAKEVVEACVLPGVVELAPLPTLIYHAFVDPSGGSQDAMTLAIAHAESGRVVLDCTREVRPPFSPEQVVDDFVACLRLYRISTVVGDRYGGEFPRELFRKQGVGYQVADKVRSELYKELLPLLNSRTVDLLDQPRLIAQCCALERHTARGGKDSIDHGPHGHDDVINAVAGALYLAHGGARMPGVFIL